MKALKKASINDVIYIKGEEIRETLTEAEIANLVELEVIHRKYAVEVEDEIITEDIKTEDPENEEDKIITEDSSDTTVETE